MRFKVANYSRLEIRLDTLHIYNHQKLKGKKEKTRNATLTSPIPSVVTTPPYGDRQFLHAGSGAGHYRSCQISAQSVHGLYGAPVGWKLPFSIDLKYGPYNSATLWCFGLRTRLATNVGIFLYILAYVIRPALEETSDNSQLWRVIIVSKFRLINVYFEIDYRPT